MGNSNINRNIISMIILYCIVFHSTIVVAANGLDPEPDQVLLRACESPFGETMEIILQGTFLNVNIPNGLQFN